MSLRAVAPPLVVAAVLLVAGFGGSSPAAHREPAPRTLDLLASAHPTSARTTVLDTAYDDAWARGVDIKADAAALSSTTCDGCAGDSVALQVVHGVRARSARLDNTAHAWAQQCRACSSTALSVQVVVLRGHPVTEPTNRASSVAAACEQCRTAALAFQVVLVADRAAPLSGGELAQLRAWVEGQAASLRASVGTPPAAPEPTPSAPTHPPTPTPTTAETPTPSADPTLPPTSTPTVKPTNPPTSEVRPVVPDRRRARRDAVAALGELEALLADAVGAEPVSAEVDVSR